MHKSKKTTEIIKALKENFAKHGIPEELRSDNGPQYTLYLSKSYSLWKRMGIQAHYQQPHMSNGKVKHAVQTIKSILKKEKDPAKALLADRSTPLACGYSASELIMQRRIRTSIPVFHTQLTPKWPDKEGYK